MVSQTEIKWRVRILNDDGKTDDMSRFCGRESEELPDCRSMSSNCYMANKMINHPKECKKCCCSVCRRASAVCHRKL